MLSNQCQGSVVLSQLDIGNDLAFQGILVFWLNRENCDGSALGA